MKNNNLFELLEVISNETGANLNDLKESCWDDNILSNILEPVTYCDNDNFTIFGHQYSLSWSFGHTGLYENVRLSFTFGESYDLHRTNKAIRDFEEIINEDILEDELEEDMNVRFTFSDIKAEVDGVSFFKKVFSKMKNPEAQFKLKRVLDTLK